MGRKWISPRLASSGSSYFVIDSIKIVITIWFHNIYVSMVIDTQTGRCVYLQNNKFKGIYELVFEANFIQQQLYQIISILNLLQFPLKQLKQLSKAKIIHASTLILNGMIQSDLVTEHYRNQQYFMNRFNQLRSPRSKPISQYSRQLKHISGLPILLQLKTKLMEGLLEEIKYKIQCLKTPKLKLELVAKLEEELMWKEIERMEKCIRQKRIEKESLENNICECEDEIVNIDQIWELKKEIKESLEEQIEKIQRKKQINEEETLISIEEVEGQGKQKEKGRESVSTEEVSMVSRKSYYGFY